ncbi:MAG: hypothetical protein HC888_02270 [Candidatus Competibacteraceae bacterium]|nr:hypothetical protein [Candidatus Competibacteraceae bacterium]
MRKNNSVKPRKSHLKLENEILKAEVLNWIQFVQMLVNGIPIIQSGGYDKDLKDLWWDRSAVSSLFSTFSSGISESVFAEHFQFRERGPKETGLWVRKNSDKDTEFVSDDRKGEELAKISKRVSELARQQLKDAGDV